MGKSFLTILFLTLLFASGETLNVVNAFGRFGFTLETTKDCLIKQAPVRIYHGLINEYSRRTNDTDIIQKIAMVERQYLVSFEQSLNETTTWAGAVKLTIDTLQVSNTELQKIVSENPGKWSPPFTSFEGIWASNVQSRMREMYEDFGKCYSDMTPCNFLDVACHAKWIFGGTPE